jgi:hypothetical protein
VKTSSTGLSDPSVQSSESSLGGTEIIWVRGAKLPTARCISDPEWSVTDTTRHGRNEAGQALAGVDVLARYVKLPFSVVAPMLLPMAMEVVSPMYIEIFSS